MGDLRRPRGDRVRAAGARREGCDRARLRHRVHLGPLGTPWRPPCRGRHHTGPARDRAGDAARVRARIPADRGGRGRDRPWATVAPTSSSPSTARRSGSIPTAGSRRRRGSFGRAASSSSCATRRSDPLLARRGPAGRRAARPAAVRAAPSRLRDEPSSSTSATATGSGSCEPTASKSSTSSSFRRHRTPRRTRTTTLSPRIGRENWPAEEIWKARKR